MLEFMFLLFKLELPEGTEVWECLSWISSDILETVLTGSHPVGVLIPSDQNLLIINVLLQSGPGSTESAVGYMQREDKMTIRTSTLEKERPGCGPALSDRVHGAHSRLGEMDAALHNPLELVEILIMCIESWKRINATTSLPVQLV